MIGTATVLTRAWCLFEIMTRLKSEREKVSILHNWRKGPTRFAHVSSVFDEMQASYEEDKTLIQSKILSKFGDKESFEGAVQNITKDSSEDIMQGNCEYCCFVIVIFFIWWVCFIIFAPCTVPYMAVGICCLIYSVINQDKENDRMFPSTAGPVGDLVISVE